MLELKVQREVGLAQYLIHLHFFFFLVVKIFFLKEFRRPRPKEILQKLSVPCRTEISDYVIRNS